LNERDPCADFGVIRIGADADIADPDWDSEYRAPSFVDGADAPSHGNVAERSLVVHRIVAARAQGFAEESVVYRKLPSEAVFLRRLDRPGGVVRNGVEELGWGTVLRRNVIRILLGAKRRALSCERDEHRTACAECSSESHASQGC
jgi:hypothetical protein